jgi:hypothetical protein
MSRRPDARTDTRRLFPAALLLIAVLGGALRIPGLFWERGLGPAGKGHTFHVDEWTFVDEIRGFDRRSPTGKGYVRGWTAHGWVAEQIGYRFLKLRDIDVIPVLRWFSWGYGLLTVVLLGIVGAVLFGNRTLGLWAAFFLAASGLHVINSHFGTADSAATFYVLLAVLLAWLFDRTKSDWALLGLGLTVGAALAIKFQLSVLPLLAWVCLRDRQRALRLIQAGAALLAGFHLFSFFDYTIWEFRDFLRMAANSVVLVDEPRFEAFYPIRKIIPGLGFGTAIVLAAGIAALAVRAGSAKAARHVRRWFESPWTLVLIPAAAQYWMVAEMDLRSARQVLVLLPAACLVAARGVVEIQRRRWRPAAGRLAAAGLALIAGYQLWSVWAIESRYRHDPRLAAAEWLAQSVQPDERVTAYLWYSRIPGPYPIVEEPAEYIVASSLEYERYLEADRPEHVFHDPDNRERWVFWRALFEGKLDYERAAVFEAPRLPIEARMRSRAGFPRDLGTFVPQRVIIFKQRRGAAGAQARTGGV